MFVKAIEEVGGFTRAIHTISRIWGSDRILAGSATLFFVNSAGWALTCAHVAKQFADGQTIADKFASFQAERANIPSGKHQRSALNQLERKYGYKSGEICELQSRLLDCVDGSVNMNVIPHPTLDLALLKFNGSVKILCENYPIFGRDGADLKQGMSICRLGFPFPEFTNFGYDALSDSIGWTVGGQAHSPRFPIDGMVTRHVADTTGKIMAFELSTPGIRGQSGGPAFDTQGRIWGIQSLTKHLDLEFDIDVDVRRGTRVRRVQDSAFLHVGGCIHVDAIKDFMVEHGVNFREG